MRNASCALAAVTLLLVSAAPSFAQDTKKTPQPVAPSPIVVETVTDQFVVAPEYKLTDMNGKAGQLVGVTGGVLMQEVFLIGGSVYHLVNGPGNWDMTYGGAVVGVQTPSEKKIRFGARSLVGLGNASNVTTYPYPTFTTPFGDMGRLTVLLNGVVPIYPDAHRGYSFSSGRVRFGENFFVFEPQGDVMFSLTKQIRFGVSAGYRWTNSSDYFQHTINGVTGTFTIQVGF